MAETSSIRAVQWTAGVGILGFLVLAVMAGFLFWQQQQLSQQINQHAFQIATQTQHWQQSHADYGKQQKQLSVFQQRLNKGEAVHRGLQESMAKITDYDRDDWMVAEAAYLIEMASARLATLQDVPSAQQQLIAASDRLKTLASPNILHLRENLENNIQALEQAKRVDWSSLWIELGQVSRQLEKLPFIRIDESPTELSGRKFSAEDWQESLSESWQEIKSLIRVRHQSAGAIVPLVTLTERAQLVHGLQFLVEEARWAVIQNEPALYHEALALIELRLKQYFDVEAKETQAVLGSLATLQSENFEVSLPDLSQSVRLVRKVQQSIAKTVHRS